MAGRRFKALEEGESRYNSPEAVVCAEFVDKVKRWV
jgi:hypothetical protein